MSAARRTAWLALILVAAFGLGPFDHPTGHVTTDLRHHEDPVGEAGPYPSDWFGIQRAFPYGSIPQDVARAAVQQARVERAALEQGYRDGTSPRPVFGASLIWTQAGPFNIGGRVTALAAAPGGATVYLGAANGGVFKSVDFGAHWLPVFDDLGVCSIGALAIDPSNPAVCYVGTGEANSSVDSYDGAGLYRSKDAGQSWQSLGLEATARIARVAVDPADSNRIFVAAMGAQFSTGPDRGLYLSEDGGEHWAKTLFANDSTGVCDVVVNPAHPETVFCATWERVRRVSYRRAYGPGCGIWRSVDHGATWTRLQSGLPAPSDSVGRIGLAIAASRPSTVVAQVVSGSINGYQGLGLYRSDDGGDTWARRDLGSSYTDNFGGFAWYFGDVAVDPTNPDHIYSLGLNLAVSSNGGSSFLSSGAPHTDQHALWIDPGNPSRVYLGNDGGFFWSMSGGLSWTKSVDLPISQFYAGTVDASNPSRLMGGTQDNSTLITSGSPTGWITTLGGDGFYCLIDPTNPSVVFAEYQFGSYGAGPQRSTDGGNGWVAPTGFNGADRYNWCAPFAMDPTNHQVLLAASQRVYKSTNNGVSYAAVSGDLTTNPPALLTYGTITTLAISPVDPSVYYAGTDDGKVWRSLNAGSSWTEISAGLPRRWVTRVTADPFDAQRVYVTLSGFSQDEHAAHVYRGSSWGSVWTAISANLPDTPANDIVVDPADAQRLFLATDVGVYATLDQGATWFPLGSGMPVQTVHDLSFHAASRKLVAATHGRSQWSLDLSSLPLAAPRGVAPPALALSAPAPNPSHSRAQLTLEASRATTLDIVVYDASGRRVRELRRGLVEAGHHTLAWDGTDDRGRRTEPGVYFVRASGSGAAVIRRLVRAE